MKNPELRISSFSKDDAAHHIIGAFEQKRSKNSKFSIRAYAKFLEIDHSLLAKFLKGEQDLSAKAKVKCLEKLGACPEQIKKLLRNSKDYYYEEVTDEQFEILSNWVHFAILELMTLPGFQLSAKKVSNRLGVSTKEAQDCLTRLLDHGYIRKEPHGYVLERTNNSYYPSRKTSRARIEHQALLLKKSANALKSRDLEERDHSSVILAISKNDIPELKEYLKSARRQLVEKFQSNKNFDEVYCLQISFFPLTK